MYFIIGFGNKKVAPRVLFMGSNAKFDVLNKEDILDQDEGVYDVFSNKDLFHTVTIYQIDEDEWRNFMGKKGSGFYLALIRTLTEEKNVNVDRILKSMKLEGEEDDEEEEEDEEENDEDEEDEEDENEDEEEEEEEDEENDEEEEEEEDENDEETQPEEEEDEE